MADQTSARTDIAASPEEVMRVISDFAAYPEWVDSITSAKVLSSTDGRPDRVQMVLEHPLIKDSYVLAYTWEPLTVHWRLVEGSMLKTMNGSYALEASGASTRVTYTLQVDLTMPMIGMFKRKAEKTIIDGALKGLKKRVEG